MTIRASNVTDLSDRELLATVKQLSAAERHATARLIAALGELDARRLYLGEGCSSLFTYCTQVLRLSEHAAYGRIEAARAARRCPRILDLLADGSITLTTVGLIAAHPTDENGVELLERVTHKSRREVEVIVAALRPRAAVPSRIRKLPTPIPCRSISNELGVVDVDLLGNDDSVPSIRANPRPIVAPLAPELYKLQFTVSRDTHDKLRRVQDLLRHSIPDGDLALIFDRALTLLFDTTTKAKVAATSHPKRASGTVTSNSRHIPASVKREVWHRDAAQCAFVGPHGRCRERGLLEFHHVVPYADGGEATVGNIQLRCRSHNAYEAVLWSGDPSVT
jgi:hypothetical protein